MTRALIPWIFIAAFVLMDIYCFTALKHVVHESTPRVKTIAYTLYWSTTVIVAVFFIGALINGFRPNPSLFVRLSVGIILGIFVSKLVLTLLLGIQDLFRLGEWAINKIAHPTPEIDTSRRVFLEKLSIGIAIIPFFSFIWGMVKTAYDYKLHRLTVPIEGLPDKLDGITICQLSDIHSGSFTQIEPILVGIESIKKLNADIFVFTGDLVNNIADEYEDYVEVFKPLKGKYGHFSILGNHDYGDYYEWDTPEEKEQNLIKLKDLHKQTGWDLLCNENRIVDIDGEKLAIIGVENWGKSFHQYGDIDKAYKGTEDVHTKVLLSHDPSYWDAKIRPDYGDIQLTLSGHTHGFQFGIETKWLRFSPAEWMYKQWAGLYQEGSQFINVNRGFGFLGYPGRVGIRPEVTLITLKKA